ncbi:TIGR03857 family LLM class F420-dependent oxidoreductase [Phenylobacterium sp. LjRoot219]|uniref:TIGR03857 family LLM class F420-dependent oxidoreductase n=1 Tax=Phenylobacterium sp. LjRoot219 TaxID=3342283 RepID=UPI003ECC7209
MNDQLKELGYYTLAGHSDTPRDLIADTRAAEQLGIGATFLSERFNSKDAAVICGAVGAVSEWLGVATGVTNHNTRHPLVTATVATTMHRLTGGRFALGLGRGFDAQFRGMGLAPITNAQIEDFAGLMRRLWRGERIEGHDGPAGKFPLLHQDAGFDEKIPIMLAALGPRTLEFAGRVMDGVILHTFFSEAAVRAAVAAVRRGAEQAGRDPDSVRVWSVLAVVPDEVPEELRLRKLVGRLGSYLRGYGDLLVQANAWEPEVLARFRADEFVRSFRGAIDGHASVEQLQHVATLIPEDWLRASATGTPEQCAQAIAREFDFGVSGVIMHGATPQELARVVEAYRQIRPAQMARQSAAPSNPGWAP